jgi:hypothetical protein
MQSKMMETYGPSSAPNNPMPVSVKQTTIKLTQDIGNFELKVGVSRYTPREGDPICYKWWDLPGQCHAMEMPPFFIFDLEQTRKELLGYVTAAAPSYITHLLKDKNTITRDTFREACQYSANASSICLINPNRLETNKA